MAESVYLFIHLFISLTLKHDIKLLIIQNKKFFLLLFLINLSNNLNSNNISQIYDIIIKII